MSSVPEKALSLMEPLRRRAPALWCSMGVFSVTVLVALGFLGCATTDRGGSQASSQSPPASGTDGAESKLRQGLSWLADDTHGVGKDFDLTLAKSITDGATTKPEIEKLFGRPQSTSTTGNSEIWTFSYQRRHLGSQKSVNGKGYRTESATRYEKSLNVTFDAAGKVSSHQVSETGNRDALQRFADGS